MIRRTGVLALLRLGGAAALLAIVGALFSAAPAVASQQEDEPPSTALRGRLTVEVEEEREPVSDVDVTITRGDEEIGSDTTDDKGEWEVELPGAGTYTATIDTDTLPEGVALRDPDSTTREIRVLEGQSRPVLFALGEGRSGGSSTLDRLTDLAVEGIRVGLVLALASIGLSLIFAVTGLVNFAHGEIVTFGALIAFLFSAAGGVPELPLALAAAIAVVAGGALGFGMERGLFRPLRRRRSGNVSLIVVTIGLSLVLRHIYLIVFEGRPRPYDEFTIQKAASFGPLSLRPKDYFVMGIAAVILFLVGVVLQRTRLGTSMRAVSDSRELAEASGIDVERVIVATWVIGAGLAALGGVLQGVSETVTWDMGFTLLLLMFAAVILGGIGTAYGAVLGAILIGLASQVSTYWISSKYRTGIALAVLIAAVLLRPQGLLGRSERIG